MIKYAGGKVMSEIVFEKGDKVIWKGKGGVVYWVKWKDNKNYVVMMTRTDPLNVVVSVAEAGEVELVEKCPVYKVGDYIEGISDDVVRHGFVVNVYEMLPDYVAYAVEDGDEEYLLDTRETKIAKYDSPPAVK
jgi:hypothetical protein